ncbi:hypothetical protein WJX72_005599 [[Myrmecia] bisecta]|uniref:Uncharacterized protein n=1 Tax=[Myrmecia] bisecta TaxID=41462 RepID=A0AAW1PBM0_9CHLO
MLSIQWIAVFQTQAGGVPSPEVLAVQAPASFHLQAAESAALPESSEGGGPAHPAERRTQTPRMFQPCCKHLNPGSDVYGCQHCEQECMACHELKAAADFVADKRCYNGIGSKCKNCRNAVAEAKLDFEFLLSNKFGINIYNVQAPVKFSYEAGQRIRYQERSSYHQVLKDVLNDCLEDKLALQAALDTLEQQVKAAGGKTKMWSYAHKLRAQGSSEE